MQRHRHQEFIRFLNAVEREVPAGKIAHAILDHYGAYMRPAVRQRIERHPRWTFHLTPTSVSWLNAFEGFFDTLTKRTLKRGVFRTIRVGHRSRQSHRRRQTRAPNVRFDLVAPSRLG
jgi:hypothetical protein